MENQLFTINGKTFKIVSNKAAAQRPNIIKKRLPLQSVNNNVATTKMILKKVLPLKASNQSTSDSKPLDGQTRATVLAKVKSEIVAAITESNSDKVSAGPAEVGAISDNTSTASIAPIATSSTSSANTTGLPKAATSQSAEVSTDLAIPSTNSDNNTTEVPPTKNTAAKVKAKSNPAKGKSIVQPQAAKADTKEIRKCGVWTQEQALDLIHQIRKYEFLYNVKDARYLNKPKKDAAYRQITADLCKDSRLGTTDDQVRAKWNVLRTQFKAENNKISELNGPSRVGHSGADGEATYTPKMQLYDDMSFLQDHIQVRNGSSNILDIDDDDEEENNANLILDDQDLNCSSVALETPKTPKLPGPPCKKSRKIATDEEMIKLMSITGEAISNLTTSRQQAAFPAPPIAAPPPPAVRDRFEEFGSFIATRLRDVPADQLKEMERKLLDCLYY